MTEYQFLKMKETVEKHGRAIIHEDDGSVTEVYKHGPGEYAVWAGWPAAPGQVAERNCVDTSWSLDRLKYLFVD